MNSPTTLRKLDLPATDPTHFVYIISNLLTKEECEEIIASHKNLKPSNISLGTIRTREEFDDRALAALLWSRMGQFYRGNRIQDEDGDWWVSKGLNPHLRLSRYEKGGKFTAHFDYRRRYSLNEQTFMSVNVYLNTVPEELKGATRVLQNEPNQGDYWDGFDELTAVAKIQPIQGTASVFRDTLWHDGEELLGGDKYLLRTDVVYEREGGWDIDRELEGLGRAERGQRMMEIAYALDEGGNREEADRWHEKAAELVPENYR